MKATPWRCAYSLNPRRRAGSPVQQQTWITALVALIGGSAGIAALVDGLMRRPKHKADATDVITNMALRLVQPLDQRVDDLETEVRQTRAMVNRLQNTMATVVLEILDPDATLPRLREVAATARAVLNETRIEDR